MTKHQLQFLTNIVDKQNYLKPKLINEVSTDNENNKDEAFIVSQITFIICSIQEGGKKIENAQAHA